MAQGIFAAVPYCIDLIGGPYIETHEEVVKAFRPKSAHPTRRRLMAGPPRRASSSRPAPTRERSVIWMHGLGADGSDFVPIVGELEPARRAASASSFRTRRCSR